MVHTIAWKNLKETMLNGGGGKAIAKSYTLNNFT